MRLGQLDAAVGSPCPYCGRVMDWRGFGPESVSREHVIPRSVGGTIVIIACQGCNNEKGAMSPFEWIEYLYEEGRRQDAIRAIKAYCKLGGVFHGGATWQKIVGACDDLRLLSPLPPEGSGI